MKDTMSGSSPEHDAPAPRMAGLAGHPVATAFALLTFAACLLAACSGTPDPGPRPAAGAAYRYASSAAMTTARIATPDKSLSVLLPRGWKETADPEGAPAIVLWMVREDYAGSISFQPLSMDPGLYLKLRRDGLVAIAKVSLSLKRQRAQDSILVVQPPETFTQSGRPFAAYEYSIDRGRTVIRIVVFDSGTRFFECALMPSSGIASAGDNRDLMEVQQSVLATLEAR